jgi:hypothetical protein
MALVNASLLVGALLVAIPIILHLTMRQQPRRVEFPAIRFVAPRRESNMRKLQMQRWILLALRCVAVLLAAAALARPSLASQLLGAWLAVGSLAILALLCTGLAALAYLGNRGRSLTMTLLILALILGTSSLATGVTTLRRTPNTLGHQAAPVAAVLIFDTSPRMAYRHENKTRLEQAGETARWLIGQLPQDSEVAVLDSQTRTAVFSLDASAAAQAAERLQVSYSPRSLPQVIEDGLSLAQTSQQAHKEIYIFTDRAEAAWPTDELVPLRQRFEAADDVSLFLIDVGVEQARNVRLGDLRLAQETIPRDGELIIETEIASQGMSGERVIELMVEEPDSLLPLIRDGEVLTPEARQRGRAVTQVTAGAFEPLQFSLKGLGTGVHHGVVRILGEDGLAIDDVRHFTLQVQEAWPILLAGPENASLRFVAESLAPFDLREQGLARFDCMQVRTADLDKINLEDFAAICLLDPPPLTESDWNRLASYVQEGGGLAIILGSHARSRTAFMNGEVAQSLLAGTLARQWRAAEREVFLAPSNFQHPMLTVFRPIAEGTPWSVFPVFRHWVLDPLSNDAQVIMRYSNQQIALAERTVGRGRVVTMTTPLSDTARPPGRVPWNELAFGENPWPQFILVNEMLLYLVSSGEQKLNYVTGQTVVLPHRDDLEPERYQLFPPDGELYEVSGVDGAIQVRFTESPGTYRLKGNRGGVILRGFSANLPAEATRLDRAPPEILDEAFGDGGYQSVREREQIERAQGRQRMGREIYPLLIILLTVVLGMEHLLANRFYRQPEGRTP